MTEHIHQWRQAPDGTMRCLACRAIADDAPDEADRDLGIERDWADHACRRLPAADLARLNDFAEQRAGHAIVRDLKARDFATEVLEELADARNYLAWWDQQIAATPTPAATTTGARMAAREALQEALVAVAVAFRTTELARTLDSGVAHP